MAGTTVTNVIQLGDSGTASQNFFLKTNVDGSMQLSRGNNPTSTQTILSISGTETVQRVMTFSAVTASSQTSIDFTGIPTWAKEITVMARSFSTNGSSNTVIQIGDAGGVENTGYTGGSNNPPGASNVNASSSFQVLLGGASAGSFELVAYLTLVDAATNTWMCSSSCARSDTSGVTTQAGSKAISPGPLDRVRLTMANGTDQFDAGTFNILVKG